ncbi:acyl-CoA dehydratase activase-related protein [Eubacterium oxidoreducens]|uniref:Predicted nucleotide-binding protein, sugar kinase/HSP70/actin superfamily n=1 Tax=Eubacterium oxidoreducens TaxID=1732 RepID=A0A1G6AND9_EUBOX|nr:acyl-CoA dehydratase activase-related protein [Eubacterium oxidoreducens]SDB09875.1 Predicted nucleotide-binding protein, sugar kinase/HSP70/actin superfamily [Eubacterium oxidoreducens]
MKLGIPRALLYYRYDVLWETFFKELGIETVLSPKTDKNIMDRGAFYSIDEACLSSKLYLGHVDSLIGKCDAIFIPRIATFQNDGVLCTRFEGLYDIVCNTFREQNLRFIPLNVDEQQKISEEKGYINLGIELGFSKREAKRAYQCGLKAHLKAQKEKQLLQENALKQPDAVKILVVAHAYNLYDEYIGVPVVEKLKELGALAIFADHLDPAIARSKYTEICKDVPWIMSRELLGSIAYYHDQIDGIILMTAFPCGPDSMLNEMIIRRIKDLPILNLLQDSQDGNAGVDTRLESFVDIIRFRKGDFL